MSAITARSVAPDAVSLVSPPVTSRSAPGKRTVTGITSLPERGAEVALSPISDQHDDTAGFFPRDRDGCRDRRAARDAAEDPLVAREPLRHRDRLVGRHDSLLVRGAFVPDRGPDRSPPVLPALNAVQRVVGVHAATARAAAP